VVFSGIGFWRDACPLRPGRSPFSGRRRITPSGPGAIPVSSRAETSAN